MKNKAVKFGIKLCVCTDSASGYTYNFDIYAGKAAGQAQGTNYGVKTALQKQLACKSTQVAA